MSDGREERTFDRLVSTLPIPDFISCLPDVPPEVRAAAEALVHRSLVTVMLGVSRPELNDFSWVYFPGPSDGWFNRISFPSNFSDRAAPAGASSAVAEITCNAGDDVWSAPDAALVEHVMERADALGVLRRDEVIASRVARTRHAYIVFDLGHRRNLDVVNAYAAKLGVTLLGRFGQFDYINTDQCLLRAFALAEAMGGGT